MEFKQLELVEKKMIEEDKFQDWWFNKGGWELTEKIYWKEASEYADKVDPDKKMNGIYTDELERLAKKNNLHKQ